MISNIRIASLNDSLIVQRSYYYFHRKLIICTIDGKRDTIEHKEYLVNRKGLPVNEIDHLYLKNTIRKAIFEYKSNTDFIRNWNEYDKAGQIKTTGHEHYLDGSLTESDEKDLSPWKHRRQEFYHFNSDKLLENHISVFQSDAQNDTIAVNYRYTIDLVGHTRKTMMQNDCSKCKDCGNCGGLTTTIIHYQR